MRKMRPSLAIWAALTIGFVFLATVVPGSLFASLGGDETSVQADQSRFQASRQTTATDRYTVHELRAPNALVVREFVSPAGKVFGVAWQGPSRPDLQQILGTYFDLFTSAARAQRLRRVARGPLFIQEPGLVVQMSGHARSFTGTAYIPSIMPVNVRAEEIR